MNKAEQFFYENAGASYRPALETLEDGKERGAKRLAVAEEWALDNGYYFDWVDDSETDGDHEGCEGGHEGCIMRSDENDHVQSLWAICGADAAYRRVVEAEMALEAMPETLIPAEVRYIA